MKITILLFLLFTLFTLLGCSIPLRLIQDSPEDTKYKQMLQTIVARYELQHEAKVLFEAVVIGYNIQNERVLSLLALKIADLYRQWDKSVLFWDYCYKNLEIDGIYQWGVQRKVLDPIKSLYESRLKGDK